MSTAGIFEQPCTDSEDGNGAVGMSENENEKKQRKYSALWQVCIYIF